LRSLVGPAGCDLPEEVVEGADRAGQERRLSEQEVPLDAIHVDAIRDDEPRIALERGHIALQEQRHLAGVSPSDDGPEAHSPIVVPASGALSYAARGFVQRAETPWLGGGGLRSATAPCDRLPRHSGGAVVAEIRLLRPAPCIRVIEAHHRASALRHFFA